MRGQSHGGLERIVASVTDDQITVTPIDVNGARRIGEMLKTNNTLQKLILNGESPLDLVTFDWP